MERIRGEPDDGGVFVKDDLTRFDSADKRMKRDRERRVLVSKTGNPPALPGDPKSLTVPG